MKPKHYNTREKNKLYSDTPLISVVIPTYNRARYVTKAIDSVLSQTFTDYEIIVIDDGSTDDTKEALQPYLSKIVYIFQENKGVSAARNTGIWAAKGKWIAFLDSDDEWLPQKLEIQMKDVQQYPKAVLSCTNVHFFGPPGTPLINFFSACISHNIRNTCFINDPFFKCYAFTSAVLAKREAIVAVGMFDEQLTIFEDGDLFFRLSTQGGFVVNPIVLVKAFRRNEETNLNLSIQYLTNKEMFHKSIITACHKYDKLDLTQIQQKHVREKISSTWFDLGIVYHSFKNRSKAMRCFLNTFQANPTWKNWMKFLLGLSGSWGITYIERRRKSKQGFRRSEYYQNDSSK